MVVWKASGATNAREAGSSSRSNLSPTNRNGYGVQRKRKPSGSPASSEANSSSAGRIRSRKRGPRRGASLRYATSNLTWSERSMNLPNPSTPALDDLIGRLQLRLNALATAATREWWTKYLRGAASFRGVKMGDARKAVHAWFEEERLGEHLSVGQQKDLALMLLEEDYTEDALAGTFFLQDILLPAGALDCSRPEERRVGQECRS